MARIYPALLVIATALAVAACLRPDAAGELMKFVGAVCAAGEREASAAPPVVGPSTADVPLWQPIPIVITPNAMSPGSEPLPKPGELGESMASDGGQPSSAAAAPNDPSEPAYRRPASTPPPSMPLASPESPWPSFRSDPIARPPDPPLARDVPVAAANSPLAAASGGVLAMPKDTLDRHFPSPLVSAAPDLPPFADSAVRLGPPAASMSNGAAPPGISPPLAGVFPEASPKSEGDPFGGSRPRETSPASEAVTRLPRTEPATPWANADQKPETAPLRPSPFASPFGEIADSSPLSPAKDDRRLPSADAAPRGVNVASYVERPNHDWPPAPVAGIEGAEQRVSPLVAQREGRSRGDSGICPGDSCSETFPAGEGAAYPQPAPSPLTGQQAGVSPQLSPTSQLPSQLTSTAPPTPAKGENGELPAEAKPCEGAQILARVGSEVILASEVLPLVNERLQPYKEKMSPSQYEEARRELIKERLQQQIEVKRIYLDAKSTIPAEGLKKFEEEVGKHYDEEELPKLMKRAGMKSRDELDKYLASVGSSVERQKRGFIEMTLASQWMAQQTKHEEDITHEEILAYYEKHRDQYTRSARVRWEELSVSFARHPDKNQAYELIARMGNQVLDGVPFAEVARQHSEGPTAASGGRWDWTTQGSLVSVPLDQALFTLAVGRLSPILEDEEGFHIIRVVERQDAGVTPFVDAQVQIKEKLRDERKNQRFDAFNERLKRQIPVWTVFDGDQPSAVSDQRARLSDQRSAFSSRL